MVCMVSVSVMLSHWAVCSVIEVIQMTGHSFHHHLFEFMLDRCGHHGNGYNTLTHTWTPHVFIRLTHIHITCSSTPQILPLLSTALGFSFPSWFHFILFFLSRVCLYVEKLLEWPDDHVPRVQIHPTVRVHVFVLFASIWETNPVESKCFVGLKSS